MENNESNMKPQQTGGLKLMTVFVVVLALHVVVIGGMTTYYLLKGGSTDADLLTDKNHKGLKANADGSIVADGTLPDATDKGTVSTASTPAPDSGTASSTPTLAPSATSTTSDQTVASDMTPTPTPTTASVEPTAPATNPATPATTSTPITASTPITNPTITAAVTTPSIAPTIPATTGTAATTPSALTPPVDPSQPAPAPATDSATAAAGTPYTVVSHDSLAKIAHKNHVTVANLMAANSLTSDKLSIGQKLVIPAKGAATTTAPVAATTPEVDSTPAVATTPSTTAETAPAPVMEKKAKTVATAKTTPAKVAAKTVASTDKHSYTIVKGDTLTKIAHKFKTTPSAIMAANGNIEPTKLTIGKKLTIPYKEAHTATSSAPAPVQPAQIETKKAPQLANVTQ